MGRNHGLHLASKNDVISGNKIARGEREEGNITRQNYVKIRQNYLTDYWQNCIKWSPNKLWPCLKAHQHHDREHRITATLVFKSDTL